MLQRATLTGFEPRDLQGVRTRYEHNLLCVAVAAAALRSLANEERVATAFDFVFGPVKREFESVHVRRQARRRCHLRHRAVK